MWATQDRTSPRKNNNPCAGSVIMSSPIFGTLPRWLWYFRGNRMISVPEIVSPCNCVQEQERGLVKTRAHGSNVDDSRATELVVFVELWRRWGSVHARILSAKVRTGAQEARRLAPAHLERRRLP